MKDILDKTLTAYEKQEEKREEAFLKARLILKSSKKAISRLHFADKKEARKLLKEARKNIEILSKLFQKSNKLRNEGFIKEALEEFVEATLFLEEENGKKELSLIGNIPSLLSDYPDVIIGGLCDFTGELTRKAITRAQKKNEQEVKRNSETVNAIIDRLLELNLSGYLRNKFDQAKHNAQKLETILYELRIRRG